MDLGTTFAQTSNDDKKDIEKKYTKKRSLKECSNDRDTGAVKKRKEGVGNKVSSRFQNTTGNALRNTLVTLPSSNLASKIEEATLIDHLYSKITEDIKGKNLITGLLFRDK
ncbi:uncharacterized protein LOC135695243 [Rhopilema esculentum]|uniref:uncharacterized protein LOC135695243 n=1 Tax=Rhopilema esculentum TaxID=499914 RepID=UPI0031D32A20